MPERERADGPQPGREPAAAQPAAPALAPATAAVLGLQRGAGNAAVARLLARTSTTALIEQGARAIAGGGPGLALRAYMAKDVAWKNALEYAVIGNHLGPVDALRHCTWSGLVMQAALEEDEEKPGDPYVLDISRIVPKAMGSPESRAWTVLMAHEHAEGGGPAMKDSVMDQKNNAAGMAMATALWKAGKRRQEDVLQEARAYLDGGKLTMFNSKGEFISTADWRKLPKETWDKLDANANPIAPAAGQPPPDKR